MRRPNISRWVYYHENPDSKLAEVYEYANPNSRYWEKRCMDQADVLGSIIRWDEETWKHMLDWDVVDMLTWRDEYEIIRKRAQELWIIAGMTGIVPGDITDIHASMLAQFGPELAARGRK